MFAGGGADYYPAIPKDALTTLDAIIVTHSSFERIGMSNDYQVRFLREQVAGQVPDGHNRLDGTVRDASYVGVSTSYVVEARGGTKLTVYEQNVERATRSELWAPGEEVRLSWSPDHTFAVPEDGATNGGDDA